MDSAHDLPFAAEHRKGAGLCSGLRCVAWSFWVLSGQCLLSEASAEPADGYLTPMGRT